MALDQSALLDLLAELKLTHVPDRIRVATETLYQALINAEATALIRVWPVVERWLALRVEVAADRRL